MTGTRSGSTGELRLVSPADDLTALRIDLRDADEATGAVDDRARLSGARVLVTTMYYRPETTGSAPYTADLAEHLAACGAQVRVVTTHPHYPQWRRPEGVANRLLRERIAGVDVVRVPGYVPRNPTLLRRAVYEATYVAMARRQLRGFSPDVVIACTPSLFAGALGAYVARQHAVPCVTVVQDLITSAAAQSWMSGSGLVRAVLSAVERWTFRHSAQVTVPSTAFAPVVRELAPDAPVTVVPNWSRLAVEAVPPDGDDAAAEAQRLAMRRRLGWEGRFVVAHTGNMGPAECLEDLAPALHHLAVALPDVLVSFVGTGVRRPLLERVTAGLNSVEVRAPVQDEDLRLLLQAADLLLLHEQGGLGASLPNDLPSYFSAGRPILAFTPRTSLTTAEILQSGGGVVLDNSDPTALVSVIKKLRNNPSQYRQLGLSSRSHALKARQQSHGLTELAAVLSRSLDHPLSK